MSPGHSQIFLALTCALLWIWASFSRSVVLDQRWRVTLPSRGHLAISGGRCYWHLVGRGQDAAIHSTMHRIAPLKPRIIWLKLSIVVGKPWSKTGFFHVVGSWLLSRLHPTALVAQGGLRLTPSDPNVNNPRKAPWSAQLGPEAHPRLVSRSREVGF